jgi:hypothetical protein
MCRRLKPACHCRICVDADLKVRSTRVKMMRAFQKSLSVVIMAASLVVVCRAADSCQADVFMPDGYSDKTLIWSPDHQKHVRLSSKPQHADCDEGTFHISIYSGTQRLTTFVPEDLSAATFVKWSPDSKGVYVMWSDGGAVGGYHVRAFLVSDTQAVESSAPRIVAEDFSRKHSCKTRGNNLYAVRWMNGSTQLLLQPEVYPTSDCGSESGFTSGYLVNMSSGAIIKRFTGEQMSPLTKGCPSDIYPTALTTQDQIQQPKKAHDHVRLSEH